MGIQGSLMSYFTEPIYFSSIILGSLYHADHLSRAMYQRIADIEDLPQQFTLNRPLLSGQSQTRNETSYPCGMNEAETHNELRITEAQKQFNTIKNLNETRVLEKRSAFVSAHPMGTTSPGRWLDAAPAPPPPLWLLAKWRVKDVIVGGY